MIDLLLKVENNEVVVKKYDITYPFTLQTLQRTTDKINWYLSSIKCKNIQGSFRILYARVFPTHMLSFGDGKILDHEKTIHAGVLKNNEKRTLYTSSTNLIFSNLIEYLVFERKLLIHVDEHDPNSYMNDRKTELPKFLIQNKETLENSVHFWIEYDDSTRKIDNEEIQLILRLEYE